MDRTPAFRLLTRLPRRWVLRADRLARARRAAAIALGPIRGWLARGTARVSGGAGDGLVISLRALPVSHSQARLLVRGRLEPLVQDALVRHVHPGAVVHDLGANVGFFTLLAARLAGAEGHVVALEPDPSSAAAVAENARLNGAGSVTVIQRAAGSSARRERLFVVSDGSWSHLESRGRHPLAASAVEVEVVALDDLVRSGEVPPPDVVKLDVEGSEVEALKGMREVLATHRPVVLCELHETAAEIAALLGDLGYAARTLEAGVDAADAGPNDHLLALPR